jgi:hypothetical protein
MDIRMSLLTRTSTGLPSWLAGRVVVGVHAVAPAVDHHGAQQRTERILPLHRLEVEIAAHPFGHAVDDRAELLQERIVDLDLQQPCEHRLEDLVGVRGHEVLPGRWFGGGGLTGQDAVVPCNSRAMLQNACPFPGRERDLMK